MKIECEMDIHEQEGNYTEYVEVSVFGRIIGGYDNVSSALKGLAGYLTRSYPNLSHTLRVNLY